MKGFALAATALVLAGAPAAFAGAAAPAPDPKGEWLVEDGRARIRVEPCGPAQPALCGNVSWVKDAPTERKTPDPAKAERSPIGLQVLLGMKPTGQNRWEGEIYNAENGKTYVGRISLSSPDVLRVEGCVLGGWLCGGQNWTRHKGPDTPAERAGPPRAKVSDAPADGTRAAAASTTQGRR